MAFFQSPASKLERAIRALLVYQGKATFSNTYIAAESVDRTLPNRTIQTTSFNPTRPYRPEGVCHLEIQHHVFEPLQPDQTNPANRVALDSFVGDTFDTLNLGGTNDQDMQPLAQAITNAGRYLATGPDAANNADMANFRVDWVQFDNPVLTRGISESKNGVNWVEIIHIKAFVSHATN